MSAIAQKVADERFAWPGGYDLFALTDDGGVLCATCCTVEAERIAEAYEGDGFYVIDLDHTGNTDEDVFCDHCYKEIHTP